MAEEKKIQKGRKKKKKEEWFKRVDYLGSLYRGARSARQRQALKKAQQASARVRKGRK